MITIIARWEDSQMLPQYEFQLWRQIRGAFQAQRLIFVGIDPGLEGYNFERYATIEEALAATSELGERVFLEPNGTKGMGDIPQGDIVLITGNTNNSNAHLANADETYKIKYPSGSTHLYPSDAAAIALAIRHGQ